MFFAGRRARCRFPPTAGPPGFRAATGHRPDQHPSSARAVLSRTAGRARLPQRTGRAARWTPAAARDRRAPAAPPITAPPAAFRQRPGPTLSTAGPCSPRGQGHPCRSPEGRVSADARPPHAPASRPPRCPWRHRPVPVCGPVPVSGVGPVDLSKDDGPRGGVGPRLAASARPACPAGPYRTRAQGRKKQPSGLNAGGAGPRSGRGGGPAALRRGPAALPRWAWSRWS